MIHLDTHVAVWLHAGQSRRLPAAAIRRLETEPVSMSPMALLEIAYLQEIGRVAGPPEEVLDNLGTALDLRLSTAPFAAIITHALSLRWTRDPFDRMIAAHALTDGASLLTADTTILANLRHAFWD